MHRYNVGEDCPYYNDGYISTTLDLQVHMLFQNPIQLFIPLSYFSCSIFTLLEFRRRMGSRLKGQTMNSTSRFHMCPTLSLAGNFNNREATLKPCNFLLKVCYLGQPLKVTLALGFLVPSLLIFQV